MKKIKVVVAGSGFAGLRAATTLRKQKKDIDITVIDKSWIHLYAGSLYKLDIGEISPSDIGFDLARLYKKKNITFVKDTLKQIDYKKNKVRCQNNTYSYDYLILAMGAQTNYFDIAHLKKYSLPLKTIDDALKIKEAIRTKINKKALQIIIGGGGLTGVEVSCELLDWAKKNFAKKLNIHLIEAKDSLVSELSHKASKFTENYLQRQGIKVHLLNSVVNTDKKFIYLKDGSKLKYDVFIWAGGIMAQDVISSSGLRSNDKGCLAVTNTLRLVGIKNIFSAGDCSYCIDLKTRTRAPQTARQALLQGEIAAKNIILEIQKKKLISYSLKPSPIIMSLGHKMGVLVYKNLTIHGRIVLILKKLIEIFYLSRAKR